MTTLERGSNRLIRLALRAGLAPRAFALLETSGRRTIRVEPLPGDFEAECIEPGERGQVGTVVGSVKHVEVFAMGPLPLLGLPISAMRAQQVALGDGVAPDDGVND